MNVSPSNEEIQATNQAFHENPRRITENTVKTIDVSATSSDSPSMPIKIIVSPSKKFQPTTLPAVQQSIKNPPQQNTEMVILNYYLINLIFINKHALCL